MPLGRGPERIQSSMSPYEGSATSVVRFGLSEYASDRCIRYALMPSNSCLG